MRESIWSVNRSWWLWPPVDRNTTVQLLWRKGTLFCSVFVGNEQTIGLGLLCVSPASGAGEMCTGEQQGRGEAGIEGEAQADGTSNELKLVANNGCPKNRWNGAVVLPKCLFSVIWDVWKGHYSSFKKRKIFPFFSPSFFLLWEPWDLTAWAFVQHLFWPRFWSLLFSLTFCLAGYYLLKTCI